MKIIYTILAITAIFIVTMFTFKEDFIYYNYAKYKVEKLDIPSKNEYYYEDNFAYIDSYDKLEIHNKEELYGAVYYIINAGIVNAQRYFSSEYENFEEDYNELFADEIKLNTINNFVHPYNSFDSIEASLKGYMLTIKVNYNEYYTPQKINEINNEVNRVLNNNISNSMTDEEKIKTIHDYIINNTIYDEEYCVDEPCITNSPYQSANAYGVLFEHYGICSGYTDLMAIFLNKLGIVNYRITNDTHTWNAVYLDNNWYHLDATWDDPISSEEILTHNYFLITTSEDEKQETQHVFDKNIFIELR